MRVVFRAMEDKPKGVLLCAMGKAGGKYRVDGSIKGVYTADDNGAFTVPLPDDPTNQEIRIAPEGSK